MAELVSRGAKQAHDCLADLIRNCEGIVCSCVLSGVWLASCLSCVHVWMCSGGDSSPRNTSFITAVFTSFHPSKIGAWLASSTATVSLMFYAAVRLAIDYETGPLQVCGVCAL